MAEEKEINSEPNEATIEIDPFDAAFDEYVTGGEAVEVRAEEEASVEAEPVAEEVEEKVEPAAEEPQKEVPADRVVPPVEEKKPEPAQPPVDIQALVNAEVEKRLAATKEKSDQEAAASAAAEARAKAAAYSDEEAQAIAAAVREMPELKSVLDAVQRVALAQAENKFDDRLHQLEKQFGERLQPLDNTVRSVAADSWNNAVLGAHKDAYELIPKLESWIKTMPSFIQPAYEQVLDNGTAAQTIELISMYKAAQTPVSKEPDQPPAGPTPEEVAEQEAREKKIQQQEGIRGRQVTKTSDALDPNNFDAAFDRFAAT